jgi:CheY-like chemotaxis protein
VNIAITGYSRTEDRRRSEQAGFDQHLVKPIDYNALVSASPLPEQRSRTAD